MVSALTIALDAIARAILGESADTGGRLGTITLRPHQREALERVRAALNEFGGALLADAPGLGKTFVALALAREFPRTIVAGPAALRSTWRDAAGRAGVPVAFVSFETLSRRDVRERGDFIIVDEAHHVCNPVAQRYARLARLIMSAPVLLLSATPVRNRKAELDAALALFLGARAATITDAARSRCIIRRTADPDLLPAIVGPVWHPPPSSPRIVAALSGLPPPVPARDGRLARALLSMSLIRCGASSLAALETALRRRLQRGAALQAVLDAGRVPTRAELRAWVVGRDAVQLAFPALVSQLDPGSVALSQTLHRHLVAIRALRDRISPRVRPDADARAALLRSLRARHPGERIIAFSAYAATAEALYRSLRNTPGVALLTARGARTASGARPRADVLNALSACVASRSRSAVDDISLVVATDVLSEGVNLQGASVVVHLDLPWHPAALEQRVGRAVRIGSPHAVVHVHGFAPPRAAERALDLGARFARKGAEWSAGLRAPAEMEHVRAIVATWRAADSSASATLSVAGVRAKLTGILAVVRKGEDLLVVAGTPQCGRLWNFDDAAGRVLELAQAIGTRELAVSSRDAVIATRRVEKWMRALRARESIDGGSTASRARRTCLRRADAILVAAPAHTRAGLAMPVMRLRHDLRRAMSAGAEMLVLELAQDPMPSGEEWLAKCAHRLALAGKQGDADASVPLEIVALLVLSSPAAGREPRPTPVRSAPPAAST